jgi:hypothetical protein
MTTRRARRRAALTNAELVEQAIATCALGPGPW